MQLDTRQALEPYQRAIADELDSILSAREGLLYRMMAYQLGWVDREGSPLPRPGSAHPFSILCLLACQALGGDFRTALPAAAALELIQTFTTVHKDVQDGSPLGEERPSVWWVWGPGQAINVGDGLHALGRSALFRLTKAGVAPSRTLLALRILDEACLEMCEGQYLDLSYQERLDITSDAYLRMARKLTGSMVGCALGLGAVAAGARRPVVGKFMGAGYDMGVAYQIGQDMQAVWAQGAPHPQVLNKKKLYPIVLLLERADLATKRAVGNIYFKRVLEPSDVKELMTMLDSNNIFSGALDIASRSFEESLNPIHESATDFDGLMLLDRYARYLCVDFADDQDPTAPESRG